jgi:hypothetical protein
MSRCKISTQRSALTTVSAILLAIMALVAGTARAHSAAGSPGATVGEGTELIYENCYEHVGAFRVPLDRIRDLVGSELPPGFAYRTFDPERTIGQINAVAIDCEQGGHGVIDVFLNALVLNEGQPTALRVRTYTNSPQSNARYALFCLGNHAHDDHFAAERLDWGCHASALHRQGRRGARPVRVGKPEHRQTPARQY